MNRVIYIIPILIVLVLMSQVDDNLSDEAENLISRIDTSGGSDAFLYLYGVFAKDGENPKNTGRNRLEEYRRLENDGFYEVVEYADSEKIALPTGDEFCSSWKAGCIEYLFSSEAQSKRLLDKYSLLVSRSNTFLEFDEYNTLSKPTINEVFPPYQYIAAAERIKVLDSISTYKNGNTRKAIDSLLVQFTKLRKAMELQDNLIGKLVFLMKLSEVIDVSSVILSKEGIKAEMIPGLSLSEKSFYMIAAREFGMSYHTFLNLDKHPEFFEMGGDFSGWLTRIAFKSNMTINSVAPLYYRLEDLAKMSPFDFEKHVEAEPFISPSTSKLRNYVGGVLIALGPEFDEYIARFNDFDTKLALFNQIHHFELGLESIKNPYYGKEVPKEIDGNLCFVGPLEDKRSLRCLRVNI
jgi:hypothetical protein